MSKLFLSIIYFAMLNMLQAQELPLREIPPYPDSYTPANVAARMIEGLGFRFYWATEGLRQQDLDFKPSPEARSAFETMEHILGLTTVILNATKNLPNLNNSQQSEKTFEEIRAKTLNNLFEASVLLRDNPNKDLGELKVIFKSDSGESSFPYWHVINGPIEDATWHTGQLITFRRSSGNPYNSKAGVFDGKVRE